MIIRNFCLIFLFSVYFFFFQPSRRFANLTAVCFIISYFLVYSQGGKHPNSKGLHVTDPQVDSASDRPTSAVI